MCQKQTTDGNNRNQTAKIKKQIRNKIHVQSIETIHYTGNINLKRCKNYTNRN
jgi:hypothetical protein